MNFTILHENSISAGNPRIVSIVQVFSEYIALLFSKPNSYLNIVQMIRKNLSSCTGVKVS